MHTYHYVPPNPPPPLGCAVQCRICFFLFVFGFEKSPGWHWRNWFAAILLTGHGCMVQRSSDGFLFCCANPFPIFFSSLAVWKKRRMSTTHNFDTFFLFLFGRRGGGDFTSGRLIRFYNPFRLPWNISAGNIIRRHFQCIVFFLYPPPLPAHKI